MRTSAVLLLRYRLVLSLVVLICACGGGDTASPPTSVPVADPPANVALSPSGPLTISGGANVPLTVTVTTKTNAVIANSTITFASSDSTVVGFSGSSLVGLKVGSATITAIATTANGFARQSIFVTVVPGAPTNLAFRIAPSATATYAPFAVRPVIEVHDVAGNVVGSSTASVSVAILSGAGTLGGTLTVQAVNGVATFADLIISGNTGARTFTFTSPGLTSVNSAPIVFGPPVAPLIVLDSTAISLIASVGTSPGPQTLKINNGGQTPFAPPSVDAIEYDGGQPGGWLTATITGTSAPFTLNLVPSTAALLAGTYHATIRISAPGALNTPQTVSVTVQVIPSFNIGFGGTAEKTRVADPGTSLTALTTLLTGVTQAPGAVSFVSRATSVATVNASGVITAVGPGQAWIVGSEAGQSDSVFVIVTNNSTGPLLRTDLTTFSGKSGDVITVNFTLDPRSTIVAGATVVVGYETENGMFTLQSARPPIQMPQPVASFSSPGVYKVNVATATGLTGPIVMLQLTLRENAPGLAGYLTFTILDAVAPDGTDVAPKVTSTRYPIIIK